MELHKKQTLQICKTIRIASVSSFRCNLEPLETIPSYEDDDYEFWSFEFSEGMGETLSLQSCICVSCGEYLVSSKGDILPRNAKCSCEHGFDKNSGCGKIEKNKKYIEMTNWDNFDAFVKAVLPEGGADYLCEDVIGEIMRFL